MQIATATQSDRRDKDVRHTAVVGMLDNAFATKRFTRNAAQQAVKQTLYKLSDFWKQNTRCNAAKKELRKRSSSTLCLSFRR